VKDPRKTPPETNHKEKRNTSLEVFDSPPWLGYRHRGLNTREIDRAEAKKKDGSQKKNTKALQTVERMSKHCKTVPKHLGSRVSSPTEEKEEQERLAQRETP